MWGGKMPVPGDMVPSHGSPTPRRVQEMQTVMNTVMNFGFHMGYLTPYTNYFYKAEGSHKTDQSIKT
jgi:hypothetical protein